MWLLKYSQMTRPLARAKELARESATFRAADLLGIEVRDLPALLEWIERGFSFQSLLRLQRAVDLPLKEVGEIVRISPRTLTRRKAEGKLTSEESDRLLRASRLFQKAKELFEGDVVAARRWLSSPNEALAGKAPLDFAKSEVGAREVEHLIVRLEHGVYS